jgi:hypothetical protein
VFLNGETRVRAGDIVTARIIHADEYDLWGEGPGEAQAMLHARQREEDDS